MNYTTLIFNNGTTLQTERNGDCFIVDNKPIFPDDLSIVIINNDFGQQVRYNVEIIEPPSPDGKYWFAFRELSPEELEQNAMKNAIQMLTDCLLEMSEIIYA